MHKFDANFRIKTRSANSESSCPWQIFENVVFVVFHVIISFEEFEKNGKLYFFNVGPWCFNELRLAGGRK